MSENYSTNQSASSGESKAQSWVYERLASSLKVGCGPSACNNVLRKSMLKRVLAAIPPPETRTVRAASGEWHTVAPGVTIKLLRVDHDAGNMTAFIRMEPGSAISAHQHSRSEECLVIEGEISIGGHHLQAGDMHVAEVSTQHARVTSAQGALMLVRGQLG